MHQHSLLAPIPADAPVPTTKSRSTARSLLVGLIVGVVFGAAIGGVMVLLDAPFLADLFQGYERVGGVSWIFIVLAMFGAILAHELGHVLGGLRVGFHFVLLVVGPLRVERDDDDRLKVRLNRDLASSGGIAALYPKDQRDLVRRFAWVIAAGPIASLVTGALCLAILAVMQEPTVAKSFVATLGGMSLALAVATLVPMKSGYYLTDGARLLQLRRGGPAAERDAAMLSLLASSTGDAPFESWSRDVVEASIGPVDGSIFELQGRSYAYGWTIAKGAVEDARAQLQRALSLTAGLPPVMRASLENELAFMDAMYPAPDGTGARDVQEPPKVLGVPEHGRLRTLAAIALARGDVAASQAHISAARAILENGKAGKTGGGKWELDRLREIEARLN